MVDAGSQAAERALREALEQLEQALGRLRELRRGEGLRASHADRALAEATAAVEAARQSVEQARRQAGGKQT